MAMDRIEDEASGSSCPFISTLEPRGEGELDSGVPGRTF